jgi:lipopolysaccharide export system protein LptC
MSEIARRIRGERQRWAAPGSSHDRIVGLSRVILPMGIGILAAFLVMAPLTMGGDVSFVLDKSKVAVAKERLRISQALYRGADSQGQPFALRAGSAVQTSTADPVVRINDLAAEIRLKDGPATLRAINGRYDMDTEKVAVDGPIEFRTADGYAMDTSDATVDLKSRTMVSQGDVTGKMPIGTFRADRLRADLEARTVTLDGRARLRIVQNGTR